MPAKSRGRVEILPEYGEALDGLEGYSHIFIISVFHKAPPEYRTLLKVRPRRLLRLGLREEELPVLGVFSTDSPVRQTPSGLHSSNSSEGMAGSSTWRGLTSSTAHP
jgi:tRNA (adenine37-N6)-methyltransferase